MSHAKRKYPNPQVHESTIGLPRYDGEVRQLIVRGNVPWTGLPIHLPAHPGASLELRFA